MEGGWNWLRIVSIWRGLVLAVLNLGFCCRRVNKGTSPGKVPWRLSPTNIVLITLACVAPSAVAVSAVESVPPRRMLMLILLAITDAKRHCCCVGGYNRFAESMSDRPFPCSSPPPPPLNVRFTPGSFLWKVCMNFRKFVHHSIMCFMCLFIASGLVGSRGPQVHCGQAFHCLPQGWASIMGEGSY
jgi:hypothetical protein